MGDNERTGIGKELERMLGSQPVEMFHPFGNHVSAVCASLVIPDYLGHRVESRRPTWLVSGQAWTTDEGVATIRINDLIDPQCVNGLGTPEITDPRPLFMATPNSEVPVVLTSRVEAAVQETGWGGAYDLITNDSLRPMPHASYTVDVTIRSWNLSGDATGVLFSWLCIAEGMTSEPPV